jgi:hypothetical protein
MDGVIVLILLFLAMDWRWRAFLFAQFGGFVSAMIG